MVIALGCANGGVSRNRPPLPAQRSVWRGSIADGDKPGNGIEIIIDGEAITGTFYILDPNKPHNFKAGLPYAMELKSRTRSEMRFTVAFGQNRIEEIVVRFHGRLEGNKVSGGYYSLHDGQDNEEPIPLTFFRQD